jgi:hypothetical protein
MKEKGGGQHQNIWGARSGNRGGLEHFLPVLMTYGVGAGRLSMEDLVRVGAENTARVFGLYPRKGVLAAGADADVVIVDPDLEATVDDAFYHCLCEVSVYRGHAPAGLRTTIVRGRVMVEDRQTAARRAGVATMRAIIETSTSRRASWAPEEDRMRVRFGINYMPTGSPPEVVRWARLVEDLGYEILGISDSQSICRDVYMTLALCAVNTERIRLGPRVITPITRHPAVAACAAATLEELAQGRTLLGSAAATAPPSPSGGDRRPSPRCAVRGDHPPLLTEGTRPITVPGPCSPGSAPGSLSTLPPPDRRRSISPARSPTASWSAPASCPRSSATPSPRSRRVRGRPGVTRAPSTCGGGPTSTWPQLSRGGGGDQDVAGRQPPEPLHREGSIPPRLLKGALLGQRYAHSHTPGSANCRLIEDQMVDYPADRFAVVGTPADVSSSGAAEAGARQFWMSVHFDDKERFLRDWATKVAPAFR